MSVVCPRITYPRAYARPEMKKFNYSLIAPQHLPLIPLFLVSLYFLFSFFHHFSYYKAPCSLLMRCIKMDYHTSHSQPPCNVFPRIIKHCIEFIHCLLPTMYSYCPPLQITPLKYPHCTTHNSKRTLNISEPLLKGNNVCGRMVLGGLMFK